MLSSGYIWCLMFICNKHLFDVHIFRYFIICQSNTLLAPSNDWSINWFQSGQEQVFQMWYFSYFVQTWNFIKKMCNYTSLLWHCNQLWYLHITWDYVALYDMEQFRNPSKMKYHFIIEGTLTTWSIYSINSFNRNSRSSLVPNYENI